MFDRIEVRRVGWALADLNVLLLKPCSNSRCSMHWSIILLKYSADGVVNALHGRKYNAPQELEAPPRIHWFHNKGIESPTISPPKTPQTITENPLPFFRCYAFSFPLFR